jgi:hypothetical protein
MCRLSWNLTASNAWNPQGGKGISLPLLLLYTWLRWHIISSVNSWAYIFSYFSWNFLAGCCLYRNYYQTRRIFFPIIIIIIIINVVSCHRPSWYFSWTSGDPHRSGFKLHTAVLSVLCVMFQVYLSLLLLLLLTANELSLGGSSPYTGTDKTNKNKYTQTKQ